MTHRWGSWLAALALFLAFAPSAEAQLTVEQRCQRDQLDVGRKLYKRGLRCWARAYARPSYALADCLIRSEESFDGSYERALRRAVRRDDECALQLRPEALLARSASEVDPLALAIGEGFDPFVRADRTLRSSLLTASGALVDALFRAERFDAKAPDESALDESYTSARAALGTAFAKAIAKAGEKGVTYAGPSADEVAEFIESFARFFAGLARPGRGAFTVAGTIAAAESTHVDSDVNDSRTEPVFNGSFEAAQLVPVPSTIGGYVNVVGAGPSGALLESGDGIDRYQVTLTAGQVVVLVMGEDPADADLDLCLTGPDVGDEVCSEGIGAIEVVAASEDGTYFIDVFPYEGCNCASTYVLSIGLAVPEGLPLESMGGVEFVPGELLVKWNGSAKARGADRALALGLVPMAGAPSREQRVRLPAPAQRARTFEALGAAAAHQRLGARASASAATPEERLRRETILALKAMRGRPDVARAELNQILRAQRVPNDPLYTFQWHYPLIGLPQAWDSTTGDPDVVIAVIDTGVVLAHPDFGGQLLPGYDFISDSTRARDGDGIDADPDDPGDLAFGPSASSFHGTHVAGTIAASSDDGSGVAGIAWGSKILPVRVLGLNGGTSYDVLQGVRYAAGLPNDSSTVPAATAQVLNLSLGGGSFSQLAQDVFDEVRGTGAIVVAAAGNENRSLPSYPAAYEGVLSVAALDLLRARAPYSNFGATIDLAAPGGDLSVDRNGDSWADGVLSTFASGTPPFLDYGYAFMQGTSMATPHVSGVIALMKSVNPALTPAQVDALLAAGDLTQDLALPGRDDTTGWGMIDARAAVEAAGAAPPATPAALAVTPSGLNFGVVIDALDLSVANTSGGALSIVSAVAESDGWLSVAELAVDGDGFGSYRAVVNRASLGAGSYSGALVFTPSSGPVTRVPVVMRIGGPSSFDAGIHSVLLIDEASLTVLDQQDVVADDGDYEYAFENVPGGNYLVIAGSDLDNDGFICDGGEACGSYPTLDLATELAVESDLTSVDFGTGFRQTISAGGPSAFAVPGRALQAPSGGSASKISPFSTRTP